MYFGEDIFMMFEHPKLSTAFGSLTKEDLKIVKDMNQVERFKSTVANLT